MNTSLQDRMTTWQALLFRLLVLWLFVCFPVIAWSETAEQEKKTVIDLGDGTVIELTNTEILRKQPKTEGRAETVIWPIVVKEPRLPLIFENRDGLRLLLYYTVTGEHSGEFRALRVEDGKTHWTHPIWFEGSGGRVRSPIFVKPWIYFGRVTWLEKMDPDDGKIIERYPSRVLITSLQTLPDGVIEVLSEDKESSVDTLTLRFQNGQFSPHLATHENSGYLHYKYWLSIEFFDRARCVMEGFVGAHNSFEYNGYLDIHKVKKVSLPPDVILQWRDFDLEEAEHAYRRAYLNDPANPYFAIYLALALYYQNRPTEAKPYFRDALNGSKHLWKESLRLGALCEKLSLTEWADRFYEQGTARYFQDVQAPPHYAFLFEVFRVFIDDPDAALFFHGHVDRAFHVLEVRRQLFPYMEGDNWFSQKYARWLRQMGQEDRAALEEQRVGKFSFYLDPAGLTPVSLAGFLMTGFLVLGAIILKNEAHSRHEALLVLITLLVVAGIVLIPDPEFEVVFVLSSGQKAGLLIVALAGYAALLSFFQRRRLQISVSQWRVMLHVLASSYLALLTGGLVAYILGELIFRSPSGGKVVEVLFLLVFTYLHYRGRRGAEAIPSFKNFTLFLFVWGLIWCQLAWFHHHAAPVRERFLWFTSPSIDLGHPKWRVFADEKVEQAEFRNRDLLFIQAAVHHLGGDFEFARQIYQQYPKDARGLNNLGVMLLNDDLKDAQVHFQQALAIDPEFAPALYNQGVITGDQGKIEESKAGDPWRVNAYQKYAPGKPWIVVPEIVPDWKYAIYWSHGGFLLRGFAEILSDVTLIFYRLVL